MFTLVNIINNGRTATLSIYGRKKNDQIIYRGGGASDPEGSTGGQSSHTLNKFPLISASLVA